MSDQVSWRVECARCARPARLEMPGPALLRRWRVVCDACSYRWRGPRPPLAIALRAALGGVLLGLALGGLAVRCSL